MKRFYAHYKNWEANKAGLYLLGINEMDVLLSIELLRDKKRFEEIAKKVSKKWVISMKVNMTITSRNKQAWIGQSACCYNHGANEDSTKEAWNRLTDHERDEANKVADIIINQYNKNA